MFRVILKYSDKEGAIKASLAEKILIKEGVQKEDITTIRNWELIKED